MISVWSNNGYKAYRTWKSGMPYFFAVLVCIEKYKYKSYWYICNIIHFSTLYDTILQYLRIILISVVIDF